MDQIRIELPDGASRELPRGTSPGAIANVLGGRLAKDAVAARLNGLLIDLATPIEADGRLALITLDSPEGIEIYRHSSAHLMAHAVKDLYGREVQVTIGPAIENGFYYDFFSENHTFSPEDFEPIEERMAELAAADLPIVREEVSRGQAIDLFRRMGETYKVQLIQDLPNETVSLYRQGEFHRPVPRPASAVDRPDQSLQADQCGRRLLARR